MTLQSATLTKFADLAIGGILALIMFIAVWPSISKSAGANISPSTSSISPIVRQVVRVTKTKSTGFFGSTSQKVSAVDVAFANNTFVILSIQNNPWVIAVKPGDRLSEYRNESTGNLVYTGINVKVSNSGGSVSPIERSNHS